MTTYQLIAWLDYAGVFVFALSGALAAARNRLDPFGFMVIGIATGVGGGTLRDLLLDQGPVFWISNPNYLLVGAVASILGWFIAPKLESRMTVLLWADALGLALFSVLGAEKALFSGAPYGVVVVMGMMSATFGGLMRDVICNEVPLLLCKEIYALAALAGAGVYLLCHVLGLGMIWGLWIGALVTFVIRACALHFNLSLPSYRGPSRKFPDDQP